MYRILLVEDDNVIASQVEKHLTAWGYEVRRATDYQNILADFAAFQPHLVLLDIGLPFFNGYHWCAEIRRQSKAPILFLSSALTATGFKPVAFPMRASRSSLSSSDRRSV